MDANAVDRDNEPQQWRLFATLMWGALITVVFILTQAFSIGIYIGANYGGLPREEFEKLLVELPYNGDVIAICTFASLFVCGALIVGIIKLKKGSVLKDYLCLNSVDFKTVRYWLYILSVPIIIFEIMSFIIGRPEINEFMVASYSSAQSVLLYSAALIIAAPVFEELFFRGFLISGLRTSFLGATGAVLVTSLLWASIHLQYDLYDMSLIFFIGVVLGVARIKTESVLLTIYLHAVVNGLSVIVTMVYVS